MVLPHNFVTAPDGSFVFPELRCLTLEYVPRPTFSTIVQKGADGSTTRIQLDPYPLWEYDITFGFLSNQLRFSSQDPHSNPARRTDYQQIMGLFLACGGQRQTFLMDMAKVTLDSSDSETQEFQIATGDGATTTFQLLRPFGGFLDLVENPIAASIKVTVAGQPAAVQSSVGGLITLTAPPPAGAAVRAGCRFLHRMRFVNDQEEAQAMWKSMYTRDKLKLVQERNETA